MSDTKIIETMDKVLSVCVKELSEKKAIAIQMENWRQLIEIDAKISAYREIVHLIKCEI